MPQKTQVSIDPPLVELPIATHDRGFYKGFARQVAIPAKVIVSLLILWVIFFPVSAMEVLQVANSTIRTVELVRPHDELHILALNRVVTQVSQSHSTVF